MLAMQVLRLDISLQEVALIMPMTNWRYITFNKIRSNILSHLKSTIKMSTLSKRFNKEWWPAVSCRFKTQLQTEKIERQTPKSKIMPHASSRYNQSKHEEINLEPKFWWMMRTVLITSTLKIVPNMDGMFKTGVTPWETCFKLFLIKKPNLNDLHTIKCGDSLNL